jgi:thioredoxin reductase
MTKPFDEVHVLVIVGSGGGSMCAALVAKQQGLSALIVEKHVARRRLDRILRWRLVGTNNAVMKRPAWTTTPSARVAISMPP